MGWWSGAGNGEVAVDQTGQGWEGGRGQCRGGFGAVAGLAVRLGVGTCG